MQLHLLVAVVNEIRDVEVVSSIITVIVHA